jgi:hypothetical protein
LFVCNHFSLQSIKDYGDMTDMSLATDFSIWKMRPIEGKRCDMSNSRKATFVIAFVLAVGVSLVSVAGHAQTSGQAEFFSPGTTTFTVPSGVSQIRAYVYGAGGGAGATTNPSNPGANGGSGAFGESIITVTAGEVLTITVGAGGAGGSPGTSQNGKSGGTTKILDGSTTVLSAGGGGGGSCAGCTPFNQGSGGAAGIGPTGSLLHTGPNGSGCGGGQTRCAYPLPDYTSDVSVGGRGFFSGSTEDDTSTTKGISGYVYLEW